MNQIGQSIPSNANPVKWISIRLDNYLTYKKLRKFKRGNEKIPAITFPANPSETLYKGNRTT
jgi:hypothetical protein